MNNEISARQLCVAGFTGLLSLSAAVANLDWRGALLAVPVTVLSVWAASASARRSGGLLKGTKVGIGKVMAVLYIIWGLFVSGTALALCARRMSEAGGQSGPLWFMALTALPVVWLTVGKPESFARAGEIFYLAMFAVVAAVFLLGAGEVEWSQLWKPGENIWSSFLTAAGIGCLGIYAVLLWNGEGGGEEKRWMGWTAAGSVILAALSGLTIGSLGPTLAARVERPFFVMTVGLGRTARTEALVAMLWLAADVTLLGLILQSCRGLWRDVLRLPGGKSVGVVLTAMTAALAFWMEWACDLESLAKNTIPIGSLILGGAAPILLWAMGKGREKAE